MDVENMRALTLALIRALRSFSGPISSATLLRWWYAAMTDLISSKVRSKVQSSSERSKVILPTSNILDASGRKIAKKRDS
jgi:hypothetical protein